MENLIRYTRCNDCFTRRREDVVSGNVSHPPTVYIIYGRILYVLIRTRACDFVKCSDPHSYARNHECFVPGVTHEMSRTFRKVIRKLFFCTILYMHGQLILWTDWLRIKKHIPAIPFLSKPNIFDPHHKQVVWLLWCR